MNEENNEFYYTNSPIDNKPKENKLSLAPILSQLSVFLIGWIGIDIIAIIIQFIFKLFVEIPSPETDEELYNQVVAKILPQIQFSTYLVTTIIVLVVLGVPLVKRIFKDITKIEKIAKGILYGILMISLTVAYNILISRLFPDLIEDNSNEKAVTDMIVNSPILSFIMIVILAPVCEEITYRFGLFGIGNHKNKYLGFALSTILFGLIHTTFQVDSTEKLLIELLNMPSYMISGFTLSLAFYKEDSLITSMTAHALNNLIAYSQTLLLPAEMVLLHGFF